MSKPLGARVPTRGWVEDDWRAAPSAQRPWPVVLVHGTSASTGDYMELARELRELGWAVFIPTYGNRATNPIEDSAEQILAYINQVSTLPARRRSLLSGTARVGYSHGT